MKTAIAKKMCPEHCERNWISAELEFIEWALQKYDKQIGEDLSFTKTDGTKWLAGQSDVNRWRRGKTLPNHFRVVLRIEELAPAAIDRARRRIQAFQWKAASRSSQILRPRKSDNEHAQWIREQIEFIKWARQKNDRELAPDFSVVTMRNGSATVDHSLDQSRLNRVKNKQLSPPKWTARKIEGLVPKAIVEAYRRIKTFEIKLKKLPPLPPLLRSSDSL